MKTIIMTIGAIAFMIYFTLAPEPIRFYYFIIAHIYLVGAIVCAKLTKND